MQIDLTDQEARIFRLMLEANVFAIRSGSFEVFLDAEGIATSIRAIQFTKLSTSTS